ncbi:MAG: hypothetical protein CL843_12470 [Crocinitomicaceae bacterium]|nr:hypothetical protein [Crocinitomicaceae bacterium]|tara:strand:- start:271 stop:1662 length:1392 start_codon:yes stop_codon:yes gene_type:complete
MKKVSQLIEEVESKFEVERVLVNGVPLWPFYKVFLFDKIYVPGGTLVKHSLGQKLKLVKHAFYGWKNYWNYSAPFLAFSLTEQRKELNGAFPDKMIDGIVEAIKEQGKTFHLELPVTDPKPKRLIPNQTTASKLPLRIVEAYYSKFGNVPQIENESILQEINAYCDVELSSDYVLRRFWGQYKAMQWFLRKRKNVKALFIVVSYMNFGSLLAAKEKGIKVIETQHGTISKEHFGYYYSKPIDDRYFPDYLLSFGENEKGFFSQTSHMLKGEKVIPVGHFYLEATYQQMKGIKRQKEEKVRVAVSLQDDKIGEKIIPFLIEAARKDNSIEYVFIPRKKTTEYYATHYDLPENIIFQPEWNIYQAIMYSDVHTSVYSTCAIEAPSLGTPNVLVNIDNRAKSYFSAFLDEYNYTLYADTPEEYLKKIKEVGKLKATKEKEIRTSNNRNIEANYFENIKAAMKIILN